MKLAKIILPFLDNDGKSLFEEHRHLQFQLMQIWGGFTSYEAIGGWRDGFGKLFNEKVVVYEVAMERGDTPKLRDLAVLIAGEARQQSVMIVTPNGDVDFVHPVIRETVSA